MPPMRASHWLLALAVAASVNVSRTSAGPETPPWKPALDRIAQARDSLSSLLGPVRKELIERVKAERPDLLPKLELTGFPRPVPVGYGILPQINPDPPQSDADATPSKERTYDLQTLESWAREESIRASGIDTDIKTKARTLDALVDDYLTGDTNFHNIDAHVKYHALWQQEVWNNPKAFVQPNEILGFYRVWRAGQTSAANHESAAEARNRLDTEMVKFNALPWHHFEQTPDGFETLKLPLMTDIRDEAFLSTLAAGVQKVWNDAPAMRRLKLRLEIVWERRDPKTLYPEGVPAQGTRIDLANHLTRFGPGFVLTTGADSVHVLGGRGIMLGGAPTTCHTIAHEVAHLLGFADGYLRAYDGSPTDPNGVKFWEVTPFPGDILSDPGSGQVSQAMARDLLQAYGPHPAPSPASIPPVR